MKQTTTALLLIAMLAGMTACGDTAATTDTTEGASGDTTTAAVETELVPELPDKTFDGKTFTIYYREHSANRYAVDREAETGDVLDDAIFRRMRNVEEKLGMKFESVMTNGDSTGDKAQNTMTAGDDSYQLVASTFRTSAKFAAAGLCYDWDELPWVDLSKPWWDVEVQDTIKLGSKRLVVLDTLSHDSLGATKAMYFVKHFFDTFNVDYPYQLVRDGKWTFDKLSEYVKMFAQDVNGDTTMNIADDNFGFIAQWWQQPMNILATADQYIAEIKGGKLAMTLNSPRTTEVFEKYFKLMETDAYYMNPNDDTTAMYDAFYAGRGAFLESTLYFADNARRMDADFGIIPSPKFDDSVDGYPSLIDGSTNGLVVPAAIKDPEFVSAVLEALCYENDRLVIPAYYNKVLQGKAVRDDDSIEMLDIIRENRTCDAGYMYLASVSGGDKFANVGQALTAQSDHNFASYYASNEASAMSALEEINSLYE